MAKRNTEKFVVLMVAWKGSFIDKSLILFLLSIRDAPDEDFCDSFESFHETH